NPAPNSNSDDESWPPATRRSRKWPTSLPNGLRANRLMGRRTNRGNNILRNAIRIYLFRQLHEHGFQTESSEARVHFSHGAAACHRAALQNHQVRTQLVGLLQNGR